ncbi:MAG: hypothetical protein AMXMBFR84_09870 [Candidatus Hydrogenedentota bacterium]
MKHMLCLLGCSFSLPWAAANAAERIVSSPYVVNAGFESPLDSKGRMPYWNAEKTEDMLQGTKGGSFAPDAANPLGGTASLGLTVTGDWYAFTSIHYPIGEWTESIAVAADARTEPGVRVQIGLVWVGAAENPIRTDLGEAEACEEKTRLSAGPFMAPEGAHSARIELVVLPETPGVAARAWFDEAAMDITDRPFVRVTVNQVGYDAQGPKRAIVQTNFKPGEGESARAQLVGGGGETVAEVPLTYAGRMIGAGEQDWGWHFWHVDFSNQEAEGLYRVKAKAGELEAESHEFRIGEDVLFRETASANAEFFYIQRCGMAIPGWHGACHLDDAKLPSGEHKDLTGGWHSAGDYNKLNWEYGDGGVAYALMTAYEADPGLFAESDRDGDGICDVVDEAWWGAKYLAKVQIADTGGILNHIEQGPDRATWMNWCPPENTTDNTPGTPDDPIVVEGPGNSPLAIGAWARLHGVLKAKGVESDYLDRARRLWDHATAGGTAVPNPLLLISTVDLYRATKDGALLDYARRNVEAILKTGQPGGQLAGGYSESGDVPAAALAYFALALPDEAVTKAIQTRLIEHAPKFVEEAKNPIGLIRQKLGPDGYYFDPSSVLGCNYMIACRAWSAFMVYRVIGDERLLRYGVDQLDFILGRNPYDVCMMEGEGTVNLPRYHHRYVTIPGHEDGAVPGAIPNGFVRDITGTDRPGLDLSTGGSRPYPSYRTNEPWLVHNVFYTLAVTALHEAV